MGAVVVIILLLSVGSVSAASVVSPYPDAELVESKVEDQASGHDLMLGALKKINNVLSAEAEEHVRGTREVEIHLIHGETRTNVVADFYQQQLDSAGINRYRCIGRECGASNHWANAVFNERILYGSSEEQRYFVSEIDSQYVVIYVTRRATGKIYVYTEVLSPDNSTTVRADLILRSLREQGRYVLPRRFDAELVSEIVDLLKNNGTMNLVVVGHTERSRKLGLTASIEQSEQEANKLSTRLREQGVSANRLTSRGVGYLAPDDRYPATRLELVVN